MIWLTGDELMALAHCLGLPRFPGVVDSMYDATDEELWPRLDGSFLSVLVAHGLVGFDDDGDPWPNAELGAVLDAVCAHQTYIAVEQLGWGLTGAVTAGPAGIVRHTISGALHGFELDPGDTDLHDRLGAVLAGQVDRSPGEDLPGRRRYWGRRSDLAGLVPSPDGGWRRATVLARVDQTGDAAYVEGFLGVFDGGPGELWLVTDYDDGDVADRRVVAEPAIAGDVDEALRVFTASIQVGARHG